MWLWLGQLWHWYTTCPSQSVDNTLIVAPHPPHLPHLGPHLPHLGHPPLIPTPQTLYLGLQRCSASICGVASRRFGGKNTSVVRSQCQIQHPSCWALPPHPQRSDLGARWVPDPLAGSE